MIVWRILNEFCEEREVVRRGTIERIGCEERSELRIHEDYQWAALWRFRRRVTTHSF
jgi:hypothetical protein